MQILNAHHRVALANGGRRLVQEVLAAIADVGMYGTWPSSSWQPLALARYGALIAGQADIMAFAVARGAR